MKFRNRNGLLTSVMVGVAALGCEAPVIAQEASSSAAEGPDGLEQEVTITGTRLRSSGMNAPTPVTVVSAAQLDEVAPGNIAAAIKQLPQFRGNIDATQNNGIGTDAGQSVVNMRGLGANRTLVLLDGRRMVPSTYNGTVDINVLPQSLLLRTDVVTGGASAAYGTDAVAGVVNFILDTNFTGFKASAQGGITGRGDGENKQGELTFGTAIGERAHLIAAAEYYDNNAITSVRPWMNSWGAVNDPAVTTDNNHYVVMPNVGSSIYTPGGLIRAPGTPLNNLQFLPDGSVVPFRLGYGTQLGVQGMSGGDAYDFRRDGSLNGGLQSAVTRWNAFSHLSFKITDTVEAWGEAMTGHNEVLSRGFPSVMFTQGAYEATIYADNAYLPQSIRQIMQQNNIRTDLSVAQPSFRLSRMSTPADITRDKLEQTNSMVEFAAGLKAELPGDWQFTSYVEHGRNQNDLADRNYPRTDRLFLAMDAVVDPANGSITCRVNLYQPGYGCVPINLLGAGRASPEAIAYVTEGVKTAYLTNKQDAFEATVTGELFKNAWKPGPIAVAFGVDYRHSTLRQNVVDPTNPTNDPTFVAVPRNNPAIGIQGIPGAFQGVNSGVQFSIQANFRGKIDVKEAFSEVQIPLLTDVPFARKLSVNVAGRWADYTGSGSIWSYKYGLDWQTLDWLRFRGTYSRDVRAANMSERYNAAGAGASVTDPFPILVNGVPTRNVQTVFSEIRGGNPTVEPERADTFAAGFVVQPPFVQGLSFSVDWYSITNKDAIALLGPQNIVNLCFQGSATICSLISRDPVTNAINGMDDRYRNINGQKVVGTDAEADYQLSLGAGRSLGFRLIGSYLDQFSLRNINVPVQQQAGTTGNLPLPRLQLNLGVNYAQGPFSLFVNERYISDGRRQWNDNKPALGGQIINDDHIASALYTDMNLTYAPSAVKGLETYLNVQNVFDRAPPRVPIFSGFNGTTDTNRALFDVLGRRFVLGVKYEL
jgi:outer membrane receptor protein involved in Fe transport